MQFGQHSKQVSRLRGLRDNSAYLDSSVRKALASDEGSREMTIKAHLAELERQHKALEHELAEALAHSSTDDLKIMELKRRKLTLKDEIERVRHDPAL